MKEGRGHDLNQKSWATLQSVLPKMTGLKSTEAVLRILRGCNVRFTLRRGHRHGAKLKALWRTPMANKSSWRPCTILWPLNYPVNVTALWKAALWATWRFHAKLHFPITSRVRQALLINIWMQARQPRTVTDKKLSKTNVYKWKHMYIGRLSSRHWRKLQN